MLRMDERNVARNGRMPCYRDGDGRRRWRGVLAGLMARLALRLAWSLMVADRAPARALEGQSPRAASRLVADEACNLRMPRVREAVGPRLGGNTNVGIHWLRRRVLRRESRCDVAGIGNERPAPVH